MSRGRWWRRFWRRAVASRFVNHDQLFKALLHEFFAEFLERFFPEEAARLDLTQVTFEEQQSFVDFPTGSRSDLDVVAKVATREGEPEMILVHVEIEGEARRR